MYNQENKEIKTQMKKTTKIAIAAAIAAAVVFPGIAALAADTSIDPVTSSSGQQRPENRDRLEKKKLELNRKQGEHEEEVEDNIANQKELAKKRAEDLRACRENNKKAKQEFLKASRLAESAKKTAQLAAQKAFKDQIKENKDGKEGRQAANEAKKIAMKKAIDTFIKAKKAAQEVRDSNSKKCLITPSTTTLPQTTTVTPATTNTSAN